MFKFTIIFIYNVAPYLNETFGSVIQQTPKDIEIIAVYDRSTDNIEGLIRRQKSDKLYN